MYALKLQKAEASRLAAEEAAELKQQKAEDSRRVAQEATEQ